MIAALLLALSLPAHAQTPQAVVTRVLARAEKLVAAQKGKDASEIRDLDHEVEILSKELKPLGWKAVPALSSAVQDLKRPAKVRLFSVSFLALTRDPAAFPPLEDILLNHEQDPTVRALAAQSLRSQGVPEALVSKTLCSALTEENLPHEVLIEVLHSLSTLGCANPVALTRIARSFGPRPDAKGLPLATAAISTLGRSRGIDSGKAILALVAYYPALGAARGAAINALDARRVDIATWLTPEALPVVVEALRSESARWDAMIPLIRVASAIGPDAGDTLLRLTKHPDAEVLAASAEALAVFKRLEALPALDAVIAGAMSDPRFSPQEGRPDPSALLARIEKAVAALRRAR